MYALGVAFTAYAAAEAVHGSGYLAAFAAGLTIAAIDVELCDCFLDYGQATAEMFLLFTFVAFGTGLIWEGFKVISVPALAFTAIALFVRSLALWISLSGMHLDAGSRKVIIWFGPRGLSSLLLVLLPVFAGLSGAETLFPICALVVLFSAVIHGAMPSLLLRRLPATTPQPSTPRAARPLPIAQQEVSPANKERITISELQRLWDAGESVTILDVRKDRTWREDDLQARGAIRIDPDRVRTTAAELALPRHGWLVAYCT